MWKGAEGEGGCKLHKRASRRGARRGRAAVQRHGLRRKQVFPSVVLRRRPFNNKEDTTH